ncbi:hypothetical protein [Sphingomonas sp. CFBP 13720]|uniref:hypothetical protein n=1 Tax=Sphingomonas sp. CFBP 13720 TaxID=2775302 RepID=UPI00177D6338|nr:hypothetical protein [Sphingomonas sp. CFBP 13720]MBD8677951.1 hypothetical protein [Sphingomonas sp. CFBP 13720]
MHATYVAATSALFAAGGALAITAIVATVAPARHRILTLLWHGAQWSNLHG